VLCFNKLMKKIKNVTAVLLAILFLAPILTSYLSSIGESADTRQYVWVQAAVMGVYNLPFFIASLVTFLVGNRYAKKGKLSTSTRLYAVSIVSSVAGTAFMILWAADALS
jgi:hypothetical protein